MRREQSVTAWTAKMMVQWVGIVIGVALLSYWVAGCKTITRAECGRVYRLAIAAGEVATDHAASDEDKKAAALKGLEMAKLAESLGCSLAKKPESE